MNLGEFSSVSARDHKRLMGVYEKSRSRDITVSDLETLKRKHEFVRDDERDEEKMSSDWEVRMARKYYDMLYKEFAIADLSRYKEGKIGLRWRTEHEVVLGKGQFVCGNKACATSLELCSYELPFSYVEHGIKKSELVKVKTCPECSKKLFYKKLKEEDAAAEKEAEREAEKKKKKRKSDDE
jgi:protein FRA10AC1